MLVLSLTAMAVRASWARTGDIAQGRRRWPVRWTTESRGVDVRRLWALNIVMAAQATQGSIARQSEGWLGGVGHRERPLALPVVVVTPMARWDEG